MEDKKNLIAKLKDNIADKEEQLQWLSTFVRLGVVVWAGAIISLNYVPLPGKQFSEKNDITFITFVFTSALATFGIDTAKKNKDKNESSNNKQHIIIETPIKIEGVEAKKVTKV